jgi:signal transduction histidine kinase
VKGSIPLSYNALPVSALDICLSPKVILTEALTSPFVLLGFVLGLVLFIWFSFRDLENVLREQRLQSELENNRKIADLSRQVAHDIRGPLTALTTLSRLSHEMGQDKLELLNLSVARIQGIANDLLSKSRPDSKNEQLINTKKSQLLGLIKSLIREYQLSYPEIKFTVHNHLSSADFTILLEPLKIERILSNLVNNSIEALQNQAGLVDLTLMERQEHWLIQVMDNGIGISEEVLPKLGQEGSSFAKEAGIGLGLYDARIALESLGGGLQINSRLGEGTQVLLIMPKFKIDFKEA